MDRGVEGWGWMAVPKNWLAPRLVQGLWCRAFFEGSVGRGGYKGSLSLSAGTPPLPPTLVSQPAPQFEEVQAPAKVAADTEFPARRSEREAGLAALPRRPLAHLDNLFLLQEVEDPG